MNVYFEENVGFWHPAMIHAEDSDSFVSVSESPRCVHPPSGHYVDSYIKCP